MKKLVAAMSTLLIAINCSAGWFGPETFDSCILDKMPGVANALAAKLVLSDCARYARAEPGAGRGFLAQYANGVECFADKGKAVGDSLGATYVFAACHQLYDLPELDPTKLVPDESPRK
ncbi:hypothetical protein [Ralstonia sp. ASV6]|uniref:hypothetical protein n=1 Tax=Ralstonia sp. ASV6 TaxID=2795124 RepID=UPI0018EE023D|nr:hypothetical protein [Ralstonia sp. ASV6]